MIAIAIMICLCITPPVLHLVDRVLPGLTLLWIGGVWLSAIIGVAVAVARRPDGDDGHEWRDRRP
jgi:hypothetical protein